MSSASAGECHECEYVYGVCIGRNSHYSLELDFLSGVKHTPELKLYGIPARYANATYMAASKANSLNEGDRVYIV